MSDETKTSPGPWTWDDDRLVLTSASPTEGHHVILAIAEDYSIPPTLADSALIADAPDMLKLLRELEWSGVEQWEDAPACPVCRTPAGTDHKECRLGALLDKLGRGTSMGAG
jgi:hypothetical protein